MKRKEMSIVKLVNCALCLLLGLAALLICQGPEYRIAIENRSPYGLDGIFVNTNGGTSLSLAVGETSPSMTFRPPAFAFSQPLLVLYIRTLHDSAGSHTAHCEFTLPVRKLLEQVTNRIIIEACPYPDDGTRIYARLEDGPGNAVNATRNWFYVAIR